ncbi:MAG: hypothetical protein Q9M50_12115 [Methylococcales bacterium]|nr:hypothetical protein [Methylococcales bacterium]
MMKSASPSELRQFTSKPWWYRIRGILMIILGGSVAILCLIAPNVSILGEKFSWIPVIGVLIFLLGILRCFDGVMALTVQGLLLNIQGGILDIVTGFLLLFSMSDDPDKLTLLIVGYLITQGVFRNVLLSVAKIPNPISSRTTGIISIILGLLIWFGWPFSSPWFLAFSLSVDASFRGWALIMLASSLKKIPTDNDQPLP